MIQSSIVKLLLAFILIYVAIGNRPARAADKPNIVYILADDLGYGDVKCLNPDGKIATPELDQLARSGMIFTDAHSSSSVCTPTRYGVLTGRYNWRTHLQQGVLGGFSRPLIDADRLTVASLLKQHGYATGCIGKWHLGMNWPLKNGKTADDGGDFSRGYADGMNVDYTAPIQDGPLDRGFDEYFGISASLDMPPYLFIRDRLATEVPTKEASLWPNRNGPVGDTFRTVDVLPRLTEEAVAFIDRHAADAQAGKPFFLYMPLNSPHTPIVPTAQWQGKSGLNSYADFVMQTDASVGQVLAALDRHGIVDNTLVIFTSDNGCSPQANFEELAEHGHDPSHVFRGHKADIYEGGHRIPFIVRWPSKIKQGAVNDQPVCLTDFMATCAELLGVQLPASAGEDSVSLLPALLGTASGPLREAVVHHSMNGSFAIRQGDWKLELCPGSGGWSPPRPGRATENLPPVQLYNLREDIAEQRSLADRQPEVVHRLASLLEQYVANGRSTPGAAQQNDAEIDIYKGHKPAATKAAKMAEGELQSFLGSPKIQLQQLFAEERFPNVVVSTDGTVVATWGATDLRVRRSEDGGASWSNEIPVGPGIHGGGALVDETTGDLLMFGHPEHPPRDGTTAPRTMYRSADGGKSWTAQEAVYRRDVNRNIPSLHMSEHGLTLRHGAQAGRLIRPARVYEEKMGEHKGYNTAIYSDDGGQTWLPSTPFPEEGTGEGAIAELTDGRLYYNSRVHWEKARQPTRRRSASSTDGGQTWKDWRLVEVLPDGRQDRAYGCMGGLVRLPVKGRDILLYSNLDTPRSVRERITVWASFDGGQTWPVKRLVYDGPSAYSSLAAGRPETPSEGWIYLLFEADEAGGRVARFNLSWLLEGEATGDGNLPVLGD